MNTTREDIRKSHDLFTINKDSVIFKRVVTLNGEVISEKTFTLEEISLEDLFQKRLSGKPGFVFKNGTTYYYTPFPRDIRFSSNSNIGCHLCPNCGRMSALPDSEGGCKKVRDRALLTRDFDKIPNKKQTVKGAKRIEKYDFITMGFETFNTKHDRDAFIILKCNNRIDMKPRDEISYVKANTIKRSLEMFWEDSYVGY